MRKLFIFFAFSFVITNMFCMESFGAPELFSGAPELFRRMNIVTRAQRSVDQKFETFSSYEQQLNADMKKRQNSYRPSKISTSLLDQLVKIFRFELLKPEERF